MKLKLKRILSFVIIFVLIAGFSLVSVSCKKGATVEVEMERI